jgi:hypothetical protein
MNINPIRCASDFLDKLLDFMQDSVQHDVRQQELSAWRDRLKPSCCTCAEFPVRNCPGSCRTADELGACDFFAEKPEIARELEIIQASEEALNVRFFQ